MQAAPDAQDASWGACGVLVPNTAYSRSKHLDACAACSEVVAGNSTRCKMGYPGGKMDLGGLMGT